MPFKSKRKCTYPGCNTLVNCGRCGKHVYFNESQRIEGVRALYNSQWWREFRLEQLRLYPWCADCQREGRQVRARDVDHPIPHRGDYDVFRSLMHHPDISMCKRHHSSKTYGEIHVHPIKKSFDDKNV